MQTHSLHSSQSCSQLRYDDDSAPLIGERETRRVVFDVQDNHVIDL